MKKIIPIAIYLPQFHPIPENDKWWGKGFTEWTNVTKATPRFKGHYQPHLPADTGFYDLRLEETRLGQEALAKQFGIQGFCYYHYWFNGKRMLHEPLDRKLKNAKEDLPFMLCWANENWTRAWDGMDKEVLLEQNYSNQDDVEHMKMLCKTYFNDSRYIKHNNKPVFLIYRPKLFPDINKTVKTWREVAINEGIGEIHIGYMQSWGIVDNPSEMGFDFAVEFQPKFGNMKVEPLQTISIFDRILKKLKKVLKIDKEIISCDTIIQYKDFVNRQKEFDFKKEVLPSITPMWDNSPRRKKNAIIFDNSTPDEYENWLNHIVQKYPWSQSSENYLFINAWNEWAEGNHLEPCQKWGTQYLERTKKVLSKS